MSGRALDRLPNLISARLSLDHDRVLESRHAFPVMARYLVMPDFQLADAWGTDKLCATGTSTRCCGAAIPARPRPR